MEEMYATLLKQYEELEEKRSLMNAHHYELLESKLTAFEEQMRQVKRDVSALEPIVSKVDALEQKMCLVKTPLSHGVHLHRYKGGMIPSNTTKLDIGGFDKAGINKNTLGNYKISLSPLQFLPNLESLTLTQSFVGDDVNGPRIPRIGMVQFDTLESTTLKKLYLNGMDEIVNYAPTLENLESLHIYGGSDVASPSILSELDVTGCPKLSVFCTLATCQSYHVLLLDPNKS